MFCVVLSLRYLGQRAIGVIKQRTTMKKGLQVLGALAGLVSVIMAASAHNWDAVLGWGVATILFIGNLGDE